MVYGKESQSQHIMEDEVYIENLVREVEDRDLHVEAMLRYGSPVEQIAAAVEEGGFDLLVLGSHGHRGLSDVVYGQTVTGVRHRVHIPVLIVRTASGGAEAAL
jgi:manganese transport protein